MQKATTTSHTGKTKYHCLKIGGKMYKTQSKLKQTLIAKILTKGVEKHELKKLKNGFKLYLNEVDCGRFSKTSYRDLVKYLEGEPNDNKRENLRGHKLSSEINRNIVTVSESDDEEITGTLTNRNDCDGQHLPEKVLYSVWERCHIGVKSVLDGLPTEPFERGRELKHRSEVIKSGTDRLREYSEGLRGIPKILASRIIYRVDRLSDNLYYLGVLQGTLGEQRETLGEQRETLETLGSITSKLSELNSTPE